MAWMRIDQLARRVIRQLELGMADEAGEDESTPPATDAPQAEGSHVAKEWEKAGAVEAPASGQGKRVNKRASRGTMIGGRRLVDTMLDTMPSGVPAGAKSMPLTPHVSVGTTLGMI